MLPNYLKNDVFVTISNLDDQSVAHYYVPWNYVPQNMQVMLFGMFELLDVCPHKRPHIAQKRVQVSQLMQSRDLLMHQFQTFIAWLITVIDGYDSTNMTPYQTVEHIFMLDVVVDI